MAKLVSIICLLVFMAKGLVGRQCYTCGYEEINGGGKTHLPDTEVPLCDDFAGENTKQSCTEPEDCCAALKEYTFQMRDDVNVTVIIGRHGCQKEMNVHLGGFELECNPEKEMCERYENDRLPSHEGETLFKAELCICPHDLCNKGDPLIPEPSSGALSGHVVRLGPVLAAALLLGALARSQ